MTEQPQPYNVVDGMVTALILVACLAGVLWLTCIPSCDSDVDAKVSGPIKAEAYHVDDFEWPREVCILTLLAEGRSGGPDEMYLIACVIYNRMQMSGMEGWQVVTEPWQFSWLNDIESDNYKNTMRIPPDSTLYGQASRIWDHVTSGKAKDRTEGATHYYTGGRPAWADKSFRKINGSIHYYGSTK